MKLEKEHCPRLLQKVWHQLTQLVNISPEGNPKDTVKWWEFMSKIVHQDFHMLFSVPEKDEKVFLRFCLLPARSSVKRTGEMKSWYKLLRLEQFGSRNSREICCYPFFQKNFLKGWKVRKFVFGEAELWKLLNVSLMWHHPRFAHISRNFLF